MVKLWEVEVQRTVEVIDTTTLEIEADTSQEAARKALEQAQESADTLFDSVAFVGEDRYTLVYPPEEIGEAEDDALRSHEMWLREACEAAAYAAAIRGIRR